MDKIKCEVIRDLMPLVADDVASAESKELVDGHMETCETCKAYYAGMTAQMVRSAMPDDGPTSTFVKFSEQMAKRVRMKKVMIVLTAALVALCVVIVGGYVVFDKANTNVPMDIEKTQAWLWCEDWGEVNLAVKMDEDHGWYNHYGVYREGDIVYLTPYEPEWKLWNEGTHGGMIKMDLNELLWEDGQLYHNFSNVEDSYDVQTDSYETYVKEYKVPIRFVRWGNQLEYKTIYEVGDEILTREEVYDLVYPSAEDEPDEMDVIEVTPRPMVTPVPDGKEETETATPEPSATVAAKE